MSTPPPTTDVGDVIRRHRTKLNDEMQRLANELQVVLRNVPSTHQSLDQHYQFMVAGVRVLEQYRAFQQQLALLNDLEGVFHPSPPPHSNSTSIREALQQAQVMNKSMLDLHRRCDVGDVADKG